jgi:hypothetical protein
MFSCGYLKLSNISGRNGTINGQGQVWWDKFHAKELTYTRGYLLELLYSNNIIISNVTFVDSPSWNLHPTYCTNVTISGITILAPLNSPNTDGIDPGINIQVTLHLINAAMRKALVCARCDELLLSMVQILPPMSRSRTATSCPATTASP